MCWPAGPRMRSGIVVALPLTAVSSQFVIGSFEARFFLRGRSFVGQTMLSVIYVVANIAGKAGRIVGPSGESDQVPAHCPNRGLCAIGDADFTQDMLDVLFDRLVADPQRLSNFL